MSSTSRIRSSMRNRARPLPMTSKSSAPPTSVQPAGTDLRHPSSSWKYTRSPVQSWRCSKTSSSRPFHGWNGCVTRHRHTDPVGPGVVDSCFQHTADPVGPSSAEGFTLCGVELPARCRMKKGRSIFGKVKVHKQCPTFSSSSSLRKAAKAAARLASHDGQRPLCLQLSVNNCSAPHVSHLSRAKPASATPQSR